MAPERFEGATADPRADIYSLGCVLHELLTGRRPFDEHNSAPSLIRAHLMLEPKAPSAAGAAVPPELDQITLRAMLKAPAQRFVDVYDMVEALRAVPGMPASPMAHPRELTSSARQSSVPLQRHISTHVGTTFRTGRPYQFVCRRATRDANARSRSSPPLGLFCS